MQYCLKILTTEMQNNVCVCVCVWLDKEIIKIVLIDGI